MKKNNLTKWLQEIRLLADVVAKYIALFFFIRYIGWYVKACIDMNKSVDLPDWLVSIITIVIIYFFRKAPRQNNNSKQKKEE